LSALLSKLNDLEDYARDKGYTEADVKAFLKDKTEKTRIKASAKTYLANAGAVDGDAESYCTVGRAEIEKGTLAGSLLRSWK
jgi:predicted transcriptional regulator